MAFAGVEAETLAAAKQPAYRWRCYPLLLQTLEALLSLLRLWHVLLK